MTGEKLSQADRQKIIDFADQYFGEYKTHQGRDGLQIVPKYCPICHGGSNHDANTFTINVDLGLFVCKRGSCGCRGWFNELQEAMGISNPVEVSRVRMPTAQKAEKQYVLPTTELHPCTEEIYGYFEKRMISKETVDAFNIQSDSRGNIVFPFYQNGQNVFEKFRVPRKLNPGENKPKMWRSPGTKPVLFNMDKCSFSQPLYITEGEIDAMSLYEAGITNVVSVPSGCEDMTWVELCWEWLERFPKIVFFGDSDEPGKKMVQTLMKRLGESRCAVVEDYPPRPNDETRTCKDANEILFFHGPFELMDVALSAKDVPVKGLLKLADVIPVDPTTVPRIKTNIPALDEVTGGLLEGGITVLLGKAGSGKSILADMIALNAIEQGNTVCVYTGEFRADRFQYWLNLQAAGSDYITLKYDAVKGKEVPVLPYTVQERIMDWYRDKLLLYNNDELFDCSQGDAILNVFESSIRKYGAKLLICDNLMMAVSDKEDEWRAQSVFANKLKKLANKYGVAILLVCHTRKTKTGEKIQANDLSGSSATNNLADIVITVEPGSMNIVKNRETGLLKTIEFCYCPDSRRIYQMDIGDKMSLSWNKEGIKPANPRADSLPDYAVVLPPTRSPF